MYRALLALAWLVGTVYSTIPLYWFMIHPFAERHRARRSPYRVLLPSWIAMMAVFLFLTWPWREVVLYRAPLAWLAAGFLLAAAVFVYRRAHLDFSHTQAMGRNELEPGREQRLITSGIRQHIRHPIYLAHLCVLLAWTVGSGEMVLYVLTFFALLTGWAMIRLEEAELERRFGDDYRAYKRAVPAALLPRISRLL